MNQIKNPATPPSIPSHTLTRQTPQSKCERSQTCTPPTLDAREKDTKHAKGSIHLYICINPVAYLFMTNTRTPSLLRLFPKPCHSTSGTDLKAGRICFEISNERVFPPFFHSKHYLWRSDWSRVASKYRRPLLGYRLSNQRS